MGKKTKKDIESSIINKGQILLAAFLVILLIVSQIAQQFFFHLSQGVGAASLLVNNFGESSQQVLDKFSTLEFLPSDDMVIAENKAISTPTSTLSSTNIQSPAAISTQLQNSSAKKTYELGLQQKGKQNLAQLKKAYPTYFGWLSDTDPIYLDLISIRFNKDGYVKGSILPLNLHGYVLYMYNGYSPNYQNGEYLNINQLPVSFQFKGKNGDIKIFNLYTSKPLTPAFAKYLDVKFIAS